jgi:hypothetical protein
MQWNLGQTVPARAGDPTADSSSSSSSSSSTKARMRRREMCITPGYVYEYSTTVNDPQFIEWTFFRGHPGDRAIAPMAPSHFQLIQHSQSRSEILRPHPTMRVNSPPTLRHLSNPLKRPVPRARARARAKRVCKVE